MKKVKILGSGCASCNQLVEAVKAVIAAEGINASVEKVEDIQQIMAYNVISTPALVVSDCPTDPFAGEFNTGIAGGS